MWDRGGIDTTAKLLPCPCPCLCLAGFDLGNAYACNTNTTPRYATLLLQIVLRFIPSLSFSFYFSFLSFSFYFSFLIFFFFFFFFFFFSL